MSSPQPRDFQRAVGKRVKRLFDVALNPPPASDPDPGNPVPYVIRKDILKYRIGFYLSLLALILLTITTPRTFLFDKTTGEFLWSNTTLGLVYLAMVLSSHYFVTGSDPGYLDLDVAVNIGQEQAQHRQISSEKIQPKRVSLRSASSSSVTSRAKLPTLISSPRLQKKKSKRKSKRAVVPAREDDSKMKQEEEKRDEVKDDDDDDEDVESTTLLRKDSDADKEEDDADVSGEDDISKTEGTAEHEMDEDLDVHESGIPLDELPIRAKFCRKSKRVVAMYDHHCQTLNTTIGERNRARFWFLLLWSTCGLIWLLGVVHSGFGNSGASVGSWLERNGHALFSAIVCWLLVLTCGGLFVFHTFLMLANVTTYEFMRADRVSYLKHTKDFDLPFSMGLLENVKFYFASDSAVLKVLNVIAGRRLEWKPHLWNKPSAGTAVTRDSTDVCKNVWENKYWSCC